MIIIVMYIVRTGFGTDGEPVGFQLATISPIIGGLLLASAGLSSYDIARDKMRRIGIFYLTAAVSFVTFGICFPMLDWNFIMPWLAGIAMLAGALSFSIATIFLAYILPSI